jgi:arylsulfatase
MSDENHRVKPLDRALNRRNILLGGTTLAATAALSSGTPTRFAQAQQQPAPAPAGGNKPNILVIFGDDIGQSNISAYTFGLMGYRTPNIDRIAKEGMMFTDYYAEQSCTAGRSSFITGQCTFRTGLSKVGIPGAPAGLQARDVTIAQLLKPVGYTTGQFGKNHLGDRNEYLPTVHGFDEFFGNLYHLNAEEEPENFNYPRDPKFKELFGPRGVLRCKAADKDDTTVDPRFGKVGKQTIEDTGPLTRKRMETIDDEISDAAVDFIKRQVAASKPFFCWMNTTRMHFRTHVRAEHRDKPGLTARTEYADGMIEHDETIGKLLKAVDDLNIAANTIVLYTTDNGPHLNAWPDAATTPFRSEKATNWEGAFRVPCMIRWPGHIKPGEVSNELFSGLDWLPTFLAAVGDPDIKDKLTKGYDVGGQMFKVHLDGFNQLPHLTGQNPKGARTDYFYFNDDGDLVGLRYENWKISFEEQRVPGTLGVWLEPFTKLRGAKLYDLHADPYERADITSNTYYDWTLDHT